MILRWEAIELVRIEELEFTVARSEATILTSSFGRAHMDELTWTSSRGRARSDSTSCICDASYHVASLLASIKRLS